MNVEKFNLEKFNITLLYQDLSKNNFSLDTISEKFGETVTIHQLNPELFVLVFNDDMQCQLGQGRLAVNWRIQDKFNKDIVNQAVNRLFEIRRLLSDVVLNAYGFNFDGQAKFAEEGKISGIIFRDIFMPDWKGTFSNIKGDMTRFNPDFRISQENKNYNIRLKASSKEEKFGFHFNIHKNENEVSNVDKLTEEVYDEYHKVKNIIREF